MLLSHSLPWYSQRHTAHVADTYGIQQIKRNAMDENTFYERRKYISCCDIPTTIVTI